MISLSDGDLTLSQGSLSCVQILLHSEWEQLSWMESELSSTIRFYSAFAHILGCFIEPTKFLVYTVAQETAEGHLLWTNPTMMWVPTSSAIRHPPPDVLSQPTQVLGSSVLVAFPHIQSHLFIPSLQGMDMASQLVCSVVPDNTEILVRTELTQQRPWSRGQHIHTVDPLIRGFGYPRSSVRGKQMILLPTQRQG